MQNEETPTWPMRSFGPGFPYAEYGEAAEALRLLAEKLEEFPEEHWRASNCAKAVWACEEELTYAVMYADHPGPKPQDEQSSEEKSREQPRSPKIKELRHERT